MCRPRSPEAGSRQRHTVVLGDFFLLYSNRGSNSSIVRFFCIYICIYSVVGNFFVYWLLTSTPKKYRVIAATANPTTSRVGLSQSSQSSQTIKLAYSSLAWLICTSTPAWLDWLASLMRQLDSDQAGLIVDKSGLPIDLDWWSALGCCEETPHQQLVFNILGKRIRYPTSCSTAWVKHHEYLYGRGL